MKNFFLILLTVTFLATLNNAHAQESEKPIELFSVADDSSENPEMLPLVKDSRVKNVILLIGDGTGLAQITTGQYALVGKNGRLYMQTMPVTGFVNTTASNNLITDSAAGATAYSCGIKTYNGAIGVDSEKDPCKTILELAEEKGMSTGLVATSRITHATPASFAAHVESRGMENEIAVDFLSSGTDVIFGGGERHFIPQNEEGSLREDDRNLIEEFSAKGYAFVDSKKELLVSDANQILGLFGNDPVEYTDEMPSLAEMTEKALGVISQNENGFFLMVEGSQIDWAGHSNNVDYAIREVERFDEAIKVALDFAVEDGQTLVVQTADHETGGMTLQKQHNKGEELEIYWTTDYHTGTPVPLMAYGPHATEFMGWRVNTYVGKKIVELLNLGPFPSVEK